MGVPNSPWTVDGNTGQPSKREERGGKREERGGKSQQANRPSDEEGGGKRAIMSSVAFNCPGSLSSVAFNCQGSLRKV